VRLSDRFGAKVQSSCTAANPREFYCPIHGENMEAYFDSSPWSRNFDKVEVTKEVKHVGSKTIDV